MRIMPDSNIIISAGLFPASRLSQTLMEIADKHTLVISTRIIEELQRVVAYKFSEKQAILDKFLCNLSYEVVYTPKEIDPFLYPIIRDKKDYPIFASAIISEVEVFITGDKDFSEVNIEYPEILTIVEFADKYL